MRMQENKDYSTEKKNTRLEPAELKNAENKYQNKINISCISKNIENQKVVKNMRYIRATRVNPKENRAQ